MPRTAIVAAAALVALPLVADAEERDRYRLEPTENGFVRMDTQTGRMSFCTERSGEFVCRGVADEGAADAGVIEELTERIEALERRITALEGVAPGEDPNALPSEEEFEQTMSLMERFLRRFMGIVKDMEDETAPQEKEPPAPDRT